MKYAVVYGSTRSERQGIKLARFMQKQLEGRGHEATLLDACDLDLPMLDKMHKQYEDGEAPEAMQRAHEVLAEADGFVFVAAEYNHSIPPALKNLIDHFQREYYFKPGGIVTYSAGPFGGVRLAPHMRAILGELGMVTPSIMFAVSRIHDAFDEQGNDPQGDYTRRVKRFLDELDWYAEALKAKRDEGTPY